MAKKKNILIIGAGMAGLTAARLLQNAGHKVTVLDKGKGYGGRMATRRLGEARCDYGAQYFSAKTLDFQILVKEAEESGAIHQWSPSHLSDGYPRWVGADGMTRFPKFLAEGLNVQRQKRVVRLMESADGWEVKTESGEVFLAEAVLLTMPAPQIMELLKNCGLELPNTTAELQKIQYEPCLALLARLNQPIDLNSLKNDELPIAWLANNQKKGISELPSVTIHASPAFSRKHLDEDLQAAGQILLELAKPHLAPAGVIDWQVHRWRYSLARQRHTSLFWKAETDNPLFFGGDGFGVGNVEGAFLSGQAMALDFIN